MELQQLRYVCAIADTGSFSRAAEQCQVAQPSLSQQILKLEDDLGTKLFDRLGRGIRLTEAGRAFLPHARSILSQLDTARSSVQERSADARGSVSVGVIPTIAPYLIPRYASTFASQYPQAKLRIVEDKTPDLIEALRSLSIDLAILALPLRQKDFQLFPLLTEPLYAVLPKDHPRAEAKAIALRELRSESFVMLRDGHCFRDLSISACSRARITPRIAFESDQFSSVLGLVAAGIGVSIAPAMALDPNAGCAYVRLSDPRATRTIVAALLHGRSFNHVQQTFLSQIAGRSLPVNTPKRLPD
jgi:LysR family hydrogen peroxide-inducible transcriptional activator